jgi:DNA polymerase/3'-5' exonuclease PolX
MVKINKETIIKNLETIRDYERFNKDVFKVKAYDNVINNILIHPKEITDINDLKDIKGIGKSIHEKLKELFDTGKISYIIDNINKDKLYKFKKELINVYGIGPSNIEKIIESGITSITQLKKNVFCLNDKQKIGLKYYKDLKKRIPLKEFKEHMKILEKDLLTKKEIKYDFVGSYRRGKKSMGDIDIIIMQNPKFDLKTYIDSLNTSGYIKSILAQGKNKFMGIVQLDEKKIARRLDILIAPVDEYYYSLLYFTGSNIFNIGMRSYVKNKFGLSLSEHGFDKNKPVIKSEKDIFEYLKLKYVEPKNRTNFIV